MGSQNYTLSCLSMSDPLGEGSRTLTMASRAGLWKAAPRLHKMSLKDDWLHLEYFIKKFEIEVVEALDWLPLLMERNLFTVYLPQFNREKFVTLEQARSCLWNLAGVQSCSFEEFTMAYWF